MKILVVTGLTGWGIGGVQSETISLVQGLPPRDVDVALVVDHVPAVLQGVTHFSIEYPPRGLAAGQIREAVLQYAPDVVHVIGGGIGILDDVEKLSLPCPWLFTAHNLPPFERILHRMHRSEWMHYLARDLKALPSIRKWKSFLKSASFSKVIAHSDIVASSLSRYGSPREKSVVIPFGSDVMGSPPPTTNLHGEVDKSDRPIHIVTVSGIAHHKGIHTFLQAFIKLSRQFPTAVYHIVGQRRDESYLQFLNAMIQSSGLGDRVQIHRNASAEERDRLLDSADLYVQPSHEEGFCLAMIEAAGRVPRLLGTRSGAIEQMLHGDPAATVVDAKSPTQLADAAAKLLRTAVDDRMLNDRRDRLHLQFSWDRYLADHVNLYRDLAGAKLAERGVASTVHA